MKMTRIKTERYTETIPEKLKGFESWEFSTGTTIQQDFKIFSKCFKEYIKENIPDKSCLVEFNRGHYILSGFIEKNNKYVYFSISDVRCFKNEWRKHILVRTAESLKDYTGGCNTYTTLKGFKNSVEKLLNSIE